MNLLRICLTSLGFVWLASAARADVLFHDDFNGTTLDPVNWAITPDDVLDRTYLNRGATVAGGLATLHLDTYSPSQSGTLLYGTEFKSTQLFARNSGIEFETRMRMSASTPNGVIQSFFAYYLNNTNPNDSLWTQDEIDVEILSNQRNNPLESNKLLLTTWNNFDFNASHLNDQVHMWQNNPAIAGLDTTQFNTYTIRWLPDHTEWLVNGVKVWETTSALADEPLGVRFNMWAPGANWQLPYSPDLQPTANPALNQSYSFDVDYVTVSSIPEPSTGIGVMLSLAALALYLTRKPAQ